MTNIIKTSMPIPARVIVAPVGKRGSKYDLGSLSPDSTDCIVLDGVDPKKDHSKLSSAVANWRKANPGTLARFSIRTFTVNEDGVDKTRVGVWRLADKAPKAEAQAEQAETAAA
jgi:hypothetical protein